MKSTIPLTPSTTESVEPALRQALEAMSYIRAKELLRLVPISKATLWRWVGSGEFPTPIKLSPGVTAWRVADVRQWLARNPTPKPIPTDGQVAVKELP